MKRRAMLQTLAAGGFVAAQGAAGGQEQKLKVFRRSFDNAETGFDPAQASDAYSREIIGNILEAPLRYDFLARPAKLRLQTAAEMPAVSADFREYTLRLKPGFFFADDPAFKGQRRELVAEDYVYAIKRLADPLWKSPVWPSLEEDDILGLNALRSEALESRKPFDYDRTVPGLRALDRYTLRVRLGEPDPRWIHNFTLNAVFGAVAREVVEHYGEDIVAHPVGTGPFRLASWRRSSQIVLERNPTYREVLYDEEAPVDDARSQKIAQRLRGRRLPMVDRIEVTIAEESQPRWLAFLNGQSDYLESIPPEFVQAAIPGNQLAPHLARRGIEWDRVALPEIVFTLFNLNDPVIGGMQPHRVALRRAISLAYDIDREIAQIRKGQMLPAVSPAPPLTFGFERDFTTDAMRHDVARAKALLDTFGYVDRDGDGWREQPDGSPLELVYHTQSDALSRQYEELWVKSMQRVGLRMRSEYGKWAEQLRASRAGKLMMWTTGWFLTVPDSEGAFVIGVSRFKGVANRAFFSHPEYDALFDRQRVLSDGPERLALLREMKRYFAVYMPYRLHGHRLRSDLNHGWVIGYRRHPFLRHWYQFIDIDPSLQRSGA
ncbi:MAG: ABC transporter substrate-binding protein [Betaproteobacteria bacterium]